MPSDPFTGGSPEDRAAIEALHERDMRASRDQDFAALRQLMSDDAVVLAPGALPLRGGAALDESFARQRTASSDIEILDYRFDWQEIRIVGDFAFEWGAIIGTMRTSPQADPLALTYNVMRILHREAPGRWRVHRTIWNERPPRRDG